MSKRIVKNLIIILVFSLVLLQSLPVQAFDPNFIISDYEMKNNTNWSLADIQSFLDIKGSYLADYSDIDPVDNKNKSAAQIIYDAAIRYNISPKVLLVTLQKEQSLITDSNPDSSQLDWATGYAVCDSCSTSDPKVLKHKGFGIQVDDAAYTYDWYYKNKTAGNIKQANKINVIDGQTIIPSSWATAFLYTYTPHIHGNQNFYKIWKQWFTQNYPNGTILKSNQTDEIWLIQNDVKRKFKSKSILITRADPKMVITVPDSELSNYTTGAEISLPNYSILKQGSNYYLLDYDTLRPFASYDVVRNFGYNPQEFIEVTSGDIAGLTLGTTIQSTAIAPQGEIYRITDYENKLYLIKDKIAYPLIDPSVAKTNYPKLTIVDRKLADLRKFPIADEIIKFKDGSLIRIASDDDFYVIENGKRRKFESEQAFVDMGYQKNNAVEVNRLITYLIEEDEPIYYSANFDASELNKSELEFLGDDLNVKVANKYSSSLPAYIVAEYPSGKILAGKNIDIKRPIASFVKVFVGFEAMQQGLDLNKATTYNPNKHSEGGYSLWLQSGTNIVNKHLLNTMIIGSYNNIARMVTDASGLTEKEMITKINERFQKWGALNTNIIDVTGLSENNISTPRELMKIFTYINQKESYIGTIMQKKRHDFSSENGVLFSINNSNSMPFDNNEFTVMASKTGYTDEAQSVLYLLIKSKKTGKTFTVLTMGNPNYNYRFNEPIRIAKGIAATTEFGLANK